MLDLPRGQAEPGHRHRAIPLPLRRHTHSITTTPIPTPLHGHHHPIYSHHYHHNPSLSLSILLTFSLFLYLATLSQPQLKPHSPRSPGPVATPFASHPQPGCILAHLAAPARLQPLPGRSSASLPRSPASSHRHLETHHCRTTVKVSKISFKL